MTDIMKKEINRERRKTKKIPRFFFFKFASNGESKTEKESEKKGL